jgi:hypothetical protein
MFGALARLLGRAGHAVANDARKAGGDVKGAITPIMNALESINPVVPQPALSPESLRPNQKAESYQAPYNVNGQQQNVGWMPHFPAANITGPKMPELLNEPDWTAVPPPSSYTPEYGDVGRPPAGTWSPTAHFITPGVSPDPWTPSSQPTGWPSAPVYKI